MITESLLIGLIAGWLFYEFAGLSPGGIITPGYFALFVDKPERIIMTLVIALLVWVIIKYLSAHLVLYGKRKFLLTVLMGFLIKLIIETYIQPVSELPFELASVGYVIPGLIANEMSKQKPVKTISALGAVTVFVYLILMLIKGGAA